MTGDRAETRSGHEPCSSSHASASTQGRRGSPLAVAASSPTASELLSWSRPSTKGFEARALPASGFSWVGLEATGRSPVVAPGWRRCWQGTPAARSKRDIHGRQLKADNKKPKPQRLRQTAGGRPLGRRAMGTLIRRDRRPVAAAVCSAWLGGTVMLPHAVLRMKRSNAPLVSRIFWCRYRRGGLPLQDVAWSSLLVKTVVSPTSPLQITLASVYQVDECWPWAWGGESALGGTGSLRGFLQAVSCGALWRGIPAEVAFVLTACGFVRREIAERTPHLA